tara:strand:+ start:47 stop:727 length:681 start_codon:yes stop_codon:yes gene_type:complete
VADLLLTATGLQYVRTVELKGGVALTPVKPEISEDKPFDDWYIKDLEPAVKRMRNASGNTKFMYSEGSIAMENEAAMVHWTNTRQGLQTGYERLITNLMEDVVLIAEKWNSRNRDVQEETDRWVYMELSDYDNEDPLRYVSLVTICDYIGLDVEWLRAKYEDLKLHPSGRCTRRAAYDTSYSMKIGTKPQGNTAVNKKRRAIQEAGITYADFHRWGNAWAPRGCQD